MTTLVVELQPEIYQRLEANARQSGKTPADWAANWLSKQLPPAQNEIEHMRESLRSAGLLAEPSEAMLAIAARADMSLEEVQRVLDEAGGQPLSEMIIEMRGPKG